MTLAQRISCAAGLVLALLCVADCQSAPARFRVLTYNIHHGAGTDGKLDLARTAEVIRNARPDLVALQEVDHRTERTGRVDQAAELGRLTGFHAVFGKAIDYSGGQYGAAILSRWPFEGTDAHVLPGSPGHEIRPALTVRVCPAPGQPELSLVSVHLDHQSERERLTQARRLLELAALEASQVVIVAGDLNAPPTSSVLELFGPDWLNSTAGQERFTFPSEKPNRQIDYVLAYPASRWRVVETRVIEGPASDHCALLAVLELTGP